jgi:hypothetical protein
MTLSNPQSTPLQWTSDPLLNGQTKTKVPRFVRSAWDESSAQNFGPWRVNDNIDPTDNQSTPPPAIEAIEPADHPALSVSPIDIVSQFVGSSELSPVEPAPDPELIKRLEDAAYKRGLLAGRQIEIHALKEQRDKERELIRNLGIELRALQQDPQRFFEPLKKLAMHVAELLVRNELQTSSTAIHGLIQACISQLDTQAAPVTVSLSPTDFQTLKNLGDPLAEHFTVLEDARLRPGSVQARLQDTVVQDLIEHRLEPLARKILAQPEQWLQSSSLLHDHIDVLPDDAPARKWQAPSSDIVDVPDKAAPGGDDEL